MANAILVKRGCRCAHAQLNGNGNQLVPPPSVPEPVETADVATQPRVEAQTQVAQQTTHNAWLIPVALVLLLLWLTK